MAIGLTFVLLGLLILLYPQILVVMISGLLVVFGLGIMATSWQFRRLRKQSNSQFINWIVKY